MHLLWHTFESVRDYFSTRRSHSTSDAQRSLFRDVSFHEFGVLLAFSFVFPCAFGAASWDSLWILLTGAKIALECAGAPLAKKRIMEFRRA